MRLNDRGRLDLGAVTKIVDVASTRYQARKRRKWRTAVHSGYVQGKETSTRVGGKIKREWIPGQARVLVLVLRMCSSRVVDE